MAVSGETLVTVTTTYLEIVGREGFAPSFLDNPDLTIIEAHEPLAPFYRFLYGTVGADYNWTDRLGWSDERLVAYLGSRTVTLLVLYYRGTPAGYVELNADSDAPGTEVAYFGLFPQFHGRGFGKHLLSTGVARAFDDGAERVWVHTCTLDGPHALKNYQARGFRPYKITTHEQPITIS
jgi:ribosomal protein S18 acetylase RimI-like enzyme